MRTCLICDDHDLMREALIGILAKHWSKAEVITANDFPSGWQMAGQARPQLILCDLFMPGASPIDGIKRMQAASPASTVIVVTAQDDDLHLLELMDIGIAGFIPKTSSSAIIEAAIQLVLAGGRYLPPRMAELASSRAASKSVADPNQASVRLTFRQLEVLRLMASGESNKDMARKLTLSPATVKAHVAAIISVLGTTNRTEAAFKARELGLV